MVKNTSRQFKPGRILSSFLSSVASRLTYFGEGPLKVQVDWLEKNQKHSVEAKWTLIEPGHPDLSITQQCKLLGLARSSYYHEPTGESEENLVLMRLLDKQYTRTPFYGARKMAAWLHTQGYPVERKRVRRLLQLMGLEAVYPKPRTSMPGMTEQRYPYLLRGMPIERCNQVWSCDITYIRLQRGFIYLIAVIDWFSRYVLSWEISITMDTSFCLEALDRALRVSRPEIFNSEEASAIYEYRVHKPTQGRRYPDQSGWERTSIRQHFRRETLAKCET